MRRHHSLLLGLLLLSACGAPAVNPDPNHTHADFAVWIDGVKLDFSAEKYMSTELKHRHEYFHLHDGVGHVVHRHKPGLTLQEFLESLGFTFTANCVRLERKQYCNTGDRKWRMAVNGVEAPFDPGTIFADLDKILLSYGADAATLKTQWDRMTDDACLYSRTCPERGEPPAENCIADPAVPCVAPTE